MNSRYDDVRVTDAHLIGQRMQKNIINLLKTAEDRVQAVRQMLSSATDLYETLAELSVSDKYVLHHPVVHNPRKQ